jgi:hypothetical protein
MRKVQRVNNSTPPPHHVDAPQRRGEAKRHDAGADLRHVDAREGGADAAAEKSKVRRHGDGGRVLEGGGVGGPSRVDFVCEDGSEGKGENEGGVEEVEVRDVRPIFGDVLSGQKLAGIARGR